jgi:hypothetical protein
MSKDQRTVSWPVATVVAIGAVAVAAALLALVPHLLVSRLSGIAREGRVAIATAYEPIAFALVVWGAVRVQRHGTS